MTEEEIMLDNKKIKIITKMPKEEIDNNILQRTLDETIDLKEVVEDVKNDK